MIMIQSNFQWQTRQVDSLIDDALVDKYKLTPMMKSILESKGYTDGLELERILAPNHLIHDPQALSDMDKAISRIHKAIQNGEKILVYGCLLYTSPSPRD